MFVDTDLCTPEETSPIARAVTPGMGPINWRAGP